MQTPRLLRLGRLLRFLEKIKHANVFRIIRLMLGMCLIAHWTACIWHALIAYFPDLDFSIEITGKLADEYLTCFYGSFVLMVGDNVNPVNNVERVFCWCERDVGARSACARQACGTSLNALASCISSSINAKLACFRALDLVDEPGRECEWR